MRFFKHFFALIFFFGIFVSATEAQKLRKEKLQLTLGDTESTERCTTDQYMKQYLEDPENAAEYEALQVKVANELENMKGQAPCVNPLIVPVAIHYNNPVTAANTTCLTDAALAQIDQMNLDFSGCNSNAGLLCDWINAGCTNFGGTAGADAMPDDGACIQFCLADQNLPAGEDNIGGYAITVGDYDWPNVPGNTWDDFMNVFVSNSQGGGILGIAPLSGAANPNGNGVYVLASAFGSQTFGGCNSGTGIGTGAPFNGGATLTHEVGHYFGLDHTFSDNLADTPPQNNPNYGCPTVNTATCTATGCQSACDDYAGNFMDYVDDDCMFAFTQDQVNVMLATAANQNQWATNSVSCAANYPPCANQAGACQVTCATQVNAQYSATQDVCYAQGTYTLPSSYPGLAVDNAQSATYAWSTGGYISTGGNQLNSATTNLTQPTGCAPVTQTLYLNVGCTDGSINLNAGTMVLTVFPDPTQLTTADITTFTAGSCNGPTYTVTPGCAPYVTVTQNGGPSFPVTSGSGSVNYDITLNYPVDCCATQGAEILLTGTIGSTTLNNGSADQACQNGTQPAIWNVTFTVPTAQNATTVGTTGLGAIKEVCIDLTVQNTDVLNITLDSPDCAQYEWEDLWLGSAFQGGSNTGPINNLCFAVM